MEKQKKIKRNTLIGDIQEGGISRERHSFIFIKVYGFAKCRLLKISFQKGLLILFEISISFSFWKANGKMLVCRTYLILLTIKEKIFILLNRLDKKFKLKISCSTTHSYQVFQSIYLWHEFWNKKVLVGITLCKNLYWKLIKYTFLQHFLRILKIELNKKNVLLGFQTLQVNHLLTIITKNYIYQCKFKDKIPNIVELKYKIKNILIYSTCTICDFVFFFSKFLN
jgi:hypothetical protein